MCSEKATLKGEFSNKPLTETLILRAELPCRDFKELLLRSFWWTERSWTCSCTVCGWCSPGSSIQPFATLLARTGMPRLPRTGISAGTSWLSQTVPACWWTPIHHLVERWLSLAAFACPFSQQLNHPRAHYLFQVELTGYEDKAFSHRWGQGALMGSHLPAELWSQLMFSTNRYRIIFPQPLLIRTFLSFPMVDQQEFLYSSSCQYLGSGAFGRGTTASSLRITCDNPISVAHISLQP